MRGRAIRGRIVQNGLESDRPVVYLMWHGDDVDDDAPDAELPGVYSSEQAAQDRTARAATLPGFAEHFPIDPSTVDEDKWTSGYIEVDIPTRSDRPSTPISGTMNRDVAGRTSSERCSHHLGYERPLRDPGGQ